jgi:hypothetical protein
MKIRISHENDAWNVHVVSGVSAWSIGPTFATREAAYSVAQAIASAKAAEGVDCPIVGKGFDNITSPHRLTPNKMTPRCDACGNYLMPCTATANGIHPNIVYQAGDQS